MSDAEWEKIGKTEPIGGYQHSKIKRNNITPILRQNFSILVKNALKSLLK